MSNVLLGEVVMPEDFDRKNIKQELEKFFKDRLTGNVTDYISSSDKEEGVTDGFVGERDGEQYMVKGDSEKPLHDEYTLREFVVGGMFKRILYDRAPTISLDIKETDAPKLDELEKQIYLRSKFLEGFETIGSIESSSGDLEAEGLEKVVAASMFLGDIDINKGNLGIMPGNPPVVAKIDHGQAFFANNIPANSLLGLTGHLVKTLGYSQHFNFSLDKFSETVGQMTQISDDEIDKLVGSRIHELKQAGFDFDEIVENYVGYDEEVDPALSSEQIVENYFRKYIKAQSATFKDLEQSLEIIKLIGPVDNKWKENDWIHEIQDKDPVLWAAENGKNIDGQDPVNWLVKNGDLSTEKGRQEIVNNILKIYSEGDEKAKQGCRNIIKDIIKANKNKDLVGQLVEKMTDSVFLENLLNEYMEKDAGKEKEDIAELYMQIITYGKDKSQILGQDSDLYYILSDPGTVDLLVNNYAPSSQGGKSNTLENLAPDDLLKSCTPELLEKVVDLGKKIDEKAGNRGTGLVQWVADIVSSLSNYFSKQIDEMTSKKFNNAIQEINGLSRDVEPIKLEKGAEIEIIGKFTEKVARERGGAAQILDRGRGG